MSEINTQHVDVLAIGAHPDDVELSCAGTLLRLKDLGYKVGMVDMTRGERGSRGSAEVRAVEAQDALKILGFEFREVLDLGDLQIQDTHERRVKVVECIRRHKPKLVLTHWWKDKHPDHIGTSALVKHAMFVAGAANFPADYDPHNPKRLLYWPSSWMMEPNVFVDITDYYEHKIRSARAHKSQFFDPDSTDPMTVLSQPAFFERLEVRARYFGDMIGVKYAEVFYMREPVKVNDPMTLCL
ncbi:MAG: bacillithiol biosynthesis deacetylase BshB1 [Calditrichaeota bacterium]|nr:bacillithiol biosynthesis deacetylase BshB1 [Calditrichota bacterium]MCB9369469.1 bacillithiol biosynthesis deacetylase BshB1 [Calditrichota bacterium]